ncbi:sodium:proton antiporter [Bordetella genomosp. 9]|uniref:Sodium:proton antiporter n=1 Tax=Bordetella genomosp. 9 TaxID=1416803 RepID=A0A261RLY3_9BORD|nr:cation:proton antiporter [Bordetella genomosp. 9]OZI26019.1 sodium:proton antiporter [Bordetella genomosp. 9]
MADPYWFVLLGALLITMVLVGTILARFLLSSAMVYLCLGYALGPGWFGLIAPDLFRHADVLERVAEAALLISLFTVGLRMGVPIFDRRWVLPLRLAFVSMAFTVGLIALVGVWGLGMSLGEAVLLGGILAPTDPVLASGVKTDRGPEPDHLRFSLAGEGGLNDGTAFPFVMLGLGLLGQHELGGGAWRWALIDLLWGTVGGLAIGAILGAMIGRLVVYLRTRHRQAVGLDEFLSLGLVALAYGAAQICVASGFLAVFAAGLALQRVEERPSAGSVPLGISRSTGEHADKVLAAHSHYASAAMTRAVHAFNAQLERLAELTLVLLVGAMLAYVSPEAMPWWFTPLFFVLLRPVAVIAGTAGSSHDGYQLAMMSWFGIRGIGSVFYLLFAIRHGISTALAQQLATITLVTVAASIMLHGASVRPLMRR